MTQAENCLTETAILKIPADYTSLGPEETFNLGKSYAPCLKEGDVVALSGPLGSGKTCFAKGIASGLGVTEELTSPTYTIISEYEGRLPVYHIDAYRLIGGDDFYSIGGEEIISGKGISIVEWSEKIDECIPENALRVDIKITCESERTISMYKGRKKTYN